MRKIDYLIKDLTFEVRQEIFNRLNNINPIMIQDFLTVGEENHSFKYFSEEGIKKIEMDYTNRFKNVNKVMEENERLGLFMNPENVYSSAREYTELLKKRELNELEELFGCSFQDYKPVIIKEK